MKGNTLVTLFILQIFVYSLLSCKKTPTEPEKRIKHPSEMTWTCDTLKPMLDGIQLLPENMLVLSPNDIWLVCYSDVARGLLWHYNGENWTESDIRKDVGGMRVNDIAKGNKANDMWVVGYSGEETFIGYYDGYKWHRHPQTWKGELLDMFKDSEGNIWACGRDGLVLKYDGNKWNANTIKLNLDYPNTYLLKSIAYFNNKAHILAITVNNNTLKQKYYFISGEINNFGIIDSFEAGDKRKWGYYGLYVSPGNELFSHGPGGYWKYVNGQWQSYFSINYQMFGISLANENYILAAGAYQNLYWSDGVKWENISGLFNIVNDPPFTFKNVWTDGYETFIIGYNFQGMTSTFVWHGK